MLPPVGQIQFRGYAKISQQLSDCVMVWQCCVQTVVWFDSVSLTVQWLDSVGPVVQWLDSICPNVQGWTVYF